MRIKELRDVSDALASMLTTERWLWVKINNIKAWQCNAIFKDLRDLRECLIYDHREEIAVKILQSIRVSDLANLIPCMSRNLQASTLISLQDLKRKRVFEKLELSVKKQAISNIMDYQEWLKGDWDSGMCPVWVLTEEFPSHYPDSMRECIVCKKSYCQLQSIVAADCTKHSFHETCEKEEGICPKCDDS